MEIPRLTPDAPATELPAFREWFGRSKVVDEAGWPLICFHGTNSRFKAFSEDQVGHFGFHVGTPDQAARFGPQQMPLYVRIENPLVLPDLGTWNYQSVIREARKAGVEITEAEYDQVFNQFDEDKALRRLLESKGYDGIAYQNEVEGEGASYIAFRPNQLKSALRNNGSYSKESDDIYR